MSYVLVNQCTMYETKIKSKRVASATKYIYDLGPLLPHLFSFWREEANMLLLYREKKE